MADFNKAYPRIKPNEGGYAKVAGDRGGETYMGIARKYHPSWKGWLIIDEYKKKGPIKHNFHIPNPSLDQMVKDFYYAKFWKVIKADQIKNDDLAANFFDMSINSGSAVKIMQSSLNKLGFKVPTNNIMGADTLTSINKANPATLNKLYLDGRKAHYEKLVKNDPGQSKFFNGWMNRLKQFTTVTEGISIIFLIGAAVGAIYLLNRLK